MVSFSNIGENQFQKEVQISIFVFNQIAWYSNQTLIKLKHFLKNNKKN